MTTAELLKNFKVADPATQVLLEAVAEHAYFAGRRDQSAEMLQVALETDERVQATLASPDYGRLKVVGGKGA